MVDALRAVHRVLRPRGFVVDLQPDPYYQPRLIVVGPRRRADVGTIVRDPDEDVIAAHTARELVLSSGAYRMIAAGKRSFRARFPTLAEFDAELDANTNWHLPRGLRARLERTWREREDDGAIVLVKRFSFAVLQKQRRSTAAVPEMLR